MNRSCPDPEVPRVDDAGAGVFGEGDRLYAAMLADIAAAERNIRLESYIFAGDAVGWRFAEALAERAGAGVTVQVHVDSAGALWQGTARLFRYLNEHGVDTRWFHRWRWRRPWRYNRRNHRKLLVVDGTTVYVGGFNLHRESSQAAYGDRRWRDVHVRVDSALGVDAARLFDELWHARRRTMAPPWRGALRLVPNANGHCRRELHCLYLDALRGAERSIDIVTPYFVPDHHLREALAAAARRGVAVRVLLPARSDNLLTELAARALAGPLLAAGVRFFEYLPRMLHGKLMLVDDCWATVGSANVDYRSFFINQELNLVCREPLVCARLAGLAAVDFADSRLLARSASNPLGPRAVAQRISRACGAGCEGAEGRPMLKLVWRQFRLDPARTLFTAAAVAAVVAVILVLEGFDQGLLRQLRDAVLQRRADLIVTQAGVSNMIAARSILPQFARSEVEAVPGVAIAHPLTGIPLIYGSHDRRTPIFLWVYQSAGGPQRLLAGHAPAAPREIVVDRSLAARHALDVGDPLVVSDFEFRISGIADGAAAFFTPFAFARYDDLIDFYFESDVAADLSSFPLLSFLLVELNDGAAADAVAGRIEAAVPAGDVYLPADLAALDVALGRTLFGPILRLLVTVAYVIGALVLAIILFAAVSARQREHGVLKALGFSTRFLGGAVVVEALLLTALALPVGIVLALGLSRAIEVLAPLYLILPLEPAPLLRTVVACLAFSVLGAVLPVRLIAHVDPSRVFGRHVMWYWGFKNLLSQPLALLASVLAAAAAFLLVLLFEAVYAGESRQIVAYVENSPADVWVMQRGVSNMHMATSYVSDWKATEVARVEGVARVDGILYLNTVVAAGSARWFAYVVGLDADATRAGPWAMAAGRALPRVGEVVVPEAFADMSGLRLGDPLRIADEEFTVVGFSKGTFSMANSVIFVARTDLEDLMSSLDILSFLLVDAEPGVDADALATRIERQVDKVTAVPARQFVSNDRRMAMQMGVETIALMTVIGGALATLLVAFTCYSLVARQRRELAVAKALGVRSGALYAAVMAQAGAVTVASLALATLLAAAVIPVVGSLVPQVSLALTGQSVARLAAAGVVVAVLAGLWPARQVARVDPASVFQS